MKFHFVKISMTVAIAVITVAFNVFSPAAALAASASAIDRQARASLDDLYKHTPGAKALGDKAVAAGNRTQPGGAGRWVRQESIDDNAAEGRVCFYFRPERADGRGRYSGIEDHPD